MDSGPEDHDERLQVHASTRSPFIGSLVIISPAPEPLLVRSVFTDLRLETEIQLIRPDYLFNLHLIIRQ